MIAGFWLYRPFFAAIFAIVGLRLEAALGWSWVPTTCSILARCSLLTEGSGLANCSCKLGEGDGCVVWLFVCRVAVGVFCFDGWPNGLQAMGRFVSPGPMAFFTVQQSLPEPLLHSKAEVDGANPDVAGAPLFQAAQRGHGFAIVKLIRARADVSRTLDGGWAALQSAVQNIHAMSYPLSIRIEFTSVLLKIR